MTTRENKRHEEAKAVVAKYVQDGGVITVIPSGVMLTTGKKKLYTFNSKTKQQDTSPIWED